MKLSELIRYCQEEMNKHGDHDVTKSIPGGHQQYKPVEIELELAKGQWLKTRSVTEDEEITIKRRSTLYFIKINEDVYGEA